MNFIGAARRSEPEEHLSRDEAQAIVGMWSLQQRLHPLASHTPTIQDMADGLGVSPDEVRAMLDRVRAGQAGVKSPKRTKKQDIRLAIIAVVVMSAVIWSVVGYVNYRRSLRMNGSPSANRTYPIRTHITNSGWTVHDYQFFFDGGEITSRSESPDQFVFALDNTVFVPPNTSHVKADLQGIQKALGEVIGGPLAESSRVLSSPLDGAEIDQMLAAGNQGVADRNLRNRARNIIEWKTVVVAYAGKRVSADLPFARVSQKNLREKVLAEQSRLLQELAESALTLAKRTPNNGQ